MKILKETLEMEMDHRDRRKPRQVRGGIRPFGTKEGVLKSLSKFYFANFFCFKRYLNPSGENSEQVIIFF